VVTEELKNVAVGFDPPRKKVRRFLEHVAGDRCLLLETVRICRGHAELPDALNSFWSATFEALDWLLQEKEKPPVPISRRLLKIRQKCLDFVFLSAKFSEPEIRKYLAERIKDYESAWDYAPEPFWGQAKIVGCPSFWHRLRSSRWQEAFTDLAEKLNFG
jgi:hypothetical protein